MRLANHPLLSRLLAGLALSAGLAGVLTSAASAATAKPMPGMDGWMRLAHLSPNTPAVDVYLYSFSSPHATLVLHHVAYGTVSPYTKVAAGAYTVAMRGAGASSTAPPVLSTTVDVMAGAAYTVAGMGPANGVKLKVLPDRLTTPMGKILVRVIQASMRQNLVTVTAGPEVLASKLGFGKLTSYQVANPGTWTFRAVGGSEHASRTIKLIPDCIHTIVILDGPGQLKIDDLLDSAGSMVMPTGGVATGLGGTAPRPASPAPWLVTMGAGALLAVAGGFAIRRVRNRPVHAR
ncbi:MAG TPA: DUF4397 domain-containing protein [Streptosporangiaceae bacterium]